MSNNIMWVRLGKPESVEDIVSLASCKARVEVIVRPSLITRNQGRPGDLYNFDLSAFYTVTVNHINARFEKTYSRGHPFKPLRKAAMSFVIANTRLNSDLAKLKKAGAEINALPFTITGLIPNSDVAEFAPVYPYNLDQFYVLAGVGEPMEISVSEKVKERDDGAQELLARYTIYCHDLEYTLEHSHGVIPKDASHEQREKVLDTAYERLIMEQRKLRRLGVPFTSNRGWGGRGPREKQEEDEEFSTGLMPACSSGPCGQGGEGTQDPGPCSCCKPKADQSSCTPAAKQTGAKKTAKGYSLTVINGWKTSPEKDQSKDPHLRVVED